MRFPSQSTISGSVAGVQYPMQAAASLPAMVPGTNIFKDRLEHVALIASPPKSVHSVDVGGTRVTETHTTMTPTISEPVVVATNTWTEGLQPTVSTRAYETMRRDVNSIFPNANVVGVQQPAGAIRTSLGTIYDPRSGTVFNHPAHFPGLASTQPTVVATEPAYASRLLSQTTQHFSTSPLAPSTGLTTMSSTGAPYSFGGAVGHASNLGGVTNYYRGTTTHSTPYGQFPRPTFSTSFQS